MYVLATEARWIQTVDVDTDLPVYVPLEVTTKETELYAETSFCEVTPCSLPERAIVSPYSSDLQAFLPMPYTRNSRSTSIHFGEFLVSSFASFDTLYDLSVWLYSTFSFLCTLFSTVLLLESRHWSA